MNLNDNITEIIQNSYYGQNSIGSKDLKWELAYKTPIEVTGSYLSSDKVCHSKSWFETKKKKGFSNICSRLSCAEMV